MSDEETDSSSVVLIIFLVLITGKNAKNVLSCQEIHVYQLQSVGSVSNSRNHVF
jgi:hypothetical protein